MKKSFFVILFMFFYTTNVFSAITVTNPSTGSGTIKLLSNAPPTGMLLESCNLGPASNCQVGVSQDTVNRNVIEAVAKDGSFFEGWTTPTGNVGSCSDSLKTCTVNGSTAGVGHAVNARFTACGINISPVNAIYSWAGGAGNITLNSNNNNCEWHVVTNRNWITIHGATNGIGSANIRYSVAVNKTNAARNGVIEIGGNQFEILQEHYLPYISIDPEPINFGTVKTRAISEVHVTVRNVSSSNTININSVQIAAENANIFTVAHNCGAISPNGLCLIRLAANPQRDGAFNGSMIVNSDDPFYPNYQINISGISNLTASANISVTPQSFTMTPIDIEFGHVRNIQVANTGTGSLLLDSVKFAGKSASEYLIINTCPIIEQGGSCNLTFYSYYSSNNPKEAFLLIRSNAQNFPIIEIPINASTPLCMSGRLNLAETSKTIDNGSTTLSVPITRTGETGCLWFATNSANWLSTNLSNTELTYTAQANNSNQLRMANVKVGGEVFTVIQHKDANNQTFDDIAGNYFENYINAIYTHRITIGCIQDVSFCPLGLVTRGEMAAFIIRALQGENFNYNFTPYYADVPSNHTFFKYVQKMRDLRITVVTGEYRINDRVTRGEMAAFIIRAIFGEDFSFTQVPYFSDVPSNHTFFKYVQKMRDMGITVVTGIYRVDDYVTRQEMAAFLARAFLNMR